MKPITVFFSYILLFSSMALFTSTIAAADPVRIGMMLPLTGRLEMFGRIQQQSAQMAAGEINASGGINGRKIELIVADTQGNPDTGRTAIEKLIKQDRVLVIGGGFSSSATWAAISVAQKNRTPFLVSSAVADKITEQGWPYIFRLNQPVSEHLDTLASFLAEVATGIKSAAILYPNSLGQAATARNFFQRAGTLGLKPVIRERFEPDGHDYQALLTRVKAKNPDLLYAVADSTKDAALLIQQSKNLGLNPKLFIGDGSGFVRPAFATRAGRASDHIVCTALWTPRLPYRGVGAFNKKFIDKYEIPPEHYGAEAYAGITVIANTLKRTRVPAPGKVRDAMSRTGMTTILGPVKFVSYKKKSQQNKLPTLLVQWLDGKAEIVWPRHLATKEVVYPIP